ncbi:hypothetical protein V2J09_003385 [Rumex salicifolius]
MQFLGAHVKRETLVSIRNLYCSISAKLLNLLKFAMSDSLPEPQSPDSPSKSDSFDPSQPSTPVSYPIKTVEELESRSYFESFHYPFNKASVPLEPNPDDGSSILPDRPRLLVCHDMAGGYLDDKWIQGGTNPDAYAIWHWYLIDVFVYFSHNLVTIPPPCWVNAAHRHGVKVLGTFITEWDEGRRNCDILLATTESAHLYAERLSELAVALGFDGWLINMEVKLDANQIPQMKEFVSHLTQTLHSSKPGSLVIWYDSVTVDGDLNWQDQLNDKNKSFFDLCDGIFVNYTWKEDYLSLSASVAGQRKYDVYMGIDVFGRNTFGGGQWNTNKALDVIKREDVSAAIFAPGWVYETKQPPDFQTAQNRWWHLVEKSWVIAQNYPRTLPFYTDFDQGHGYHLYANRNQVSDAPWCNLSCQSLQPLLEPPEGSRSNTMQVLVNSEGPSFNGGGNLTFTGFLDDSGYFMSRLFKGKLLMEQPLLHSANDEKKQVLLASRGHPILTMNMLSQRFSTVILPSAIIDSAKGWFIMVHLISMQGYTLTGIHSVCYKLGSSSADYHAVLGHISIKTLSQNVNPPPADSWTVEGESINWISANSEGSKYLSLKIVWRLTNGSNAVFPKYDIYVEKIFKQSSDDSYHEPNREPLYVGVAQVKAFYVSDLLVSTDTSHVKFIVQVSSVDGTAQKLDDSPSLLLSVQG